MCDLVSINYISILGTHKILQGLHSKSKTLYSRTMLTTSISHMSQLRPSLGYGYSHWRNHEGYLYILDVETHL